MSQPQYLYDVAAVEKHIAVLALNVAGAVGEGGPGILILGLRPKYSMKVEGAIGSSDKLSVLNSLNRTNCAI